MCQLFTTLFADDINLHLSEKDLNQLQTKVNDQIKNVDFWIRASNMLKLYYIKLCVKK